MLLANRTTNNRSKLDWRHGRATASFIARSVTPRLTREVKISSGGRAHISSIRDLEIFRKRYSHLGDVTLILLWQFSIKSLVLLLVFSLVSFTLIEVSCKTPFYSFSATALISNKIREKRLTIITLGRTHIKSYSVDCKIFQFSNDPR